MYICGLTFGNWDGVNRNYQDCAAVKLDSEGKEVWRWQVGEDLDGQGGFHWHSLQ